MTLSTTSPGDERLPHADSVQRVGSTIYVLNARGHNRWSAQVQPGRDDNDERISDSECESIAEALARFGTRPVAEPVLPAGWVPLTIAFDGDTPEEVAYGPQIMMDRLKKWLDKFYALRLATEPSQSGSAGEAASDDFGKYVALAERCGAEVGRHEGQMVWMKFHRQSSVEAFVTGIAMLAALSRQAPAAPTQALLGWTRYEKARKLNVAQWAELHQRNLRGENFDDMIDALPATTQPAQQDMSGWRPIATAPKNTPVRLYAQHGGFYDEDFNPSGSVEGHWTDGIGWSGAFWDSVHDTWFCREGIVPTHWQPLPEPMAGDPGATPPAEKQAAPSGEDNHG